MAVVRTDFGGSAGYDARVVSNYLLDCADEAGLTITNLQIQKIIFFSHVSYLKSFGRKLVKNHFEAWEHGPVVRPLFDEFKRAGASPIKHRAEILDVMLGQKVFADPATISEHDRSILLRLCMYYAPIDAWTLRHWSHEKSGPWDLALRQFRFAANLGARLDEANMREFTPSHPCLMDLRDEY